jgi:hypothetical protein
MPIMDTLAMDILTNLQGAKDTAMSDTDNEFLQTSWHFDRATGNDVAKVVFIFDGIATISPDASPDEHKERMGKAVNAARDQVGNAAALFGRNPRAAALRFMRWLIAGELGAETNDERNTYAKVRREFYDIMEGL